MAISPRCKSLLLRPLVLAGVLAFLAACESRPDGTFEFAAPNGPAQATIVETTHPLFVDRKGKTLLVRLPRCGDFSKRTGYNPRNDSYGNWGCASQHNFGLMVANPATVAGAAAFEPRDATRSSKVIKDHRAGEPTQSDFGGGAVSIIADVGG